MRFVAEQLDKCIIILYNSTQDKGIHKVIQMRQHLFDGAKNFTENFSHRGCFFIIILDYNTFNRTCQDFLTSFFLFQKNKK